MRTWRLCLSRYAKATGEGARLYGGRWNLPGTPMVYTAETLSLAVLEYLVNFDSDLFPDDLVVVTAEIPPELPIQSLEPDDLPADWGAYPAPESVRALGAAWAASQKTAVLAVPSVVVPEERNYLLNPRHQDFPRIRWSEPRPFHWDPRLRK